jgi:hypothetical protein
VVEALLDAGALPPAAAAAADTATLVRALADACRPPWTVSAIVYLPAFP